MFARQIKVSKSAKGIAGWKTGTIKIKGEYAGKRAKRNIGEAFLASKLAGAGR